MQTSEPVCEGKFCLGHFDTDETCGKPRTQQPEKVVMHQHRNLQERVLTSETFESRDRKKEDKILL
jgi:hypothetical protein